MQHLRSKNTASHLTTKAPVAKATLASMHTYVNTAMENTPDFSAQNIDKANSTQDMQNHPTMTCTGSHPPPKKKTENSVVTPINMDNLAEYLQGYDPTLLKILIAGLRYGFRIPYQGLRQFRLSNNLPSLRGNESVLWQKINNEIKLGRVGGPFPPPPFSNLQVSPLGLVPKKNPGEFRLIHHLSHPEGSSVNDHIPHELCTVQYQTIDNAISAIKEIGVGALLAKTDLENAYKQVPVHPDDGISSRM